MPGLLDILEVGFMAFLAFDFVRQLRTTYTRRLFKVVFGAGWKKLLLYWLLDLPVLAIVLTIGTLLVSWPGLKIPAFWHFKATPIMSFSWLQLLAEPGKPETGGNLAVAGVTKIPILGLGFLVLLFLNLPRLARTEEEWFRRGTKNWLDGCWRSLKFGLVHCLVGVPIGYGLALGLGGIWFTYHYFKGGVRRSTMVHTMYNATLVMLLAVFLVLMMWPQPAHPVAR